MSIILAQHEFLLDVCLLVRQATSYGFVVTAGELWRPPEMQQIYVKTGRSKTMKSKHLERLAVDLNFFKNGKYIQSYNELVEVGKFWESLNSKNRWGGNFSSFKDLPHFERRI